MSKTIFGLNSKLTFGKHKGETVQWVIDHDAGYLEWANDNIEWFELTAEAEEALEDALSEKADQHWRDEGDPWLYSEPPY